MHRIARVAAWAILIGCTVLLVAYGDPLAERVVGRAAPLELAQFTDGPRMASHRAVRDSLAQRKDSLQKRREEALRNHEAARQRYDLAREQADAQKAPDGMRLDSLKALERSTEAELERLDVALLAIVKAQEANREAEVDLEMVAVKRMKQAESRRHLTALALQLAVGLPLILLAGFVLTRGSATNHALKELAGGACPGCHGHVMVGPKGPSNFCVHCGLRLFDLCSNCRGRKNAFYNHCPDCGASAIVPPPPFNASS